MSSDNKYNLYTEHVVPDKVKKKRKLFKKILNVCLMAVIFGVVASGIIIVSFNLFCKPDDHDEKTPSITIPVVQSPTEETTEPVNVPDKEQLSHSGAFYEEIKTAVRNINKSHVNIIVEGLNNDATLQGGTASFDGFAILNSEHDYYILTEYNAAFDSADIFIQYNSSDNIKCQYIGTDYNTHLSILKATIEEPTLLTPITTANSKIISPGDGVIVMGNLQGRGTAIGCGIVTDNSSYIFKTDAEYAAIQTDVTGRDNTFAIICNMKGNLIAVQTAADETGAQGICSGYSISDIVVSIQNVANSVKRNYMGINGVTVSEELMKRYNFPNGVYVTSVESGSPAFDAGIQSGDIICQIQELQIEDMKDYMSAVSSQDAHGRVTVVAKRKNMAGYKDVVFTFNLGVK